MCIARVVQGSGGMLMSLDRQPAVEVQADERGRPWHSAPLVDPGGALYRVNGFGEVGIATRTTSSH